MRGVCDLLRFITELFKVIVEDVLVGGVCWEVWVGGGREPWYDGSNVCREVWHRGWGRMGNGVAGLVLRLDGMLVGA